ncbi:Fanconi anemia group E protein [Theobroma cacao]|uniref:C-terminal, putative n=1 Tax=Theobroma cacao TaxID=3641 RepID=A0A061GKS3_THECC|nr:C-terminal, putative [Theobroma cacao]WRX35229.1 Fanconi anemia group E protein [Theobroma cacao]
MEPWVPLFDIFMNSPTPETEASLWLQQSFNATTSSSSTTTPITTSSFLSLLTKPCNPIVKDSSFSSPPTTKRIMFIETLPSMIQSRILSFLALEKKRFDGKELSKLARNLLSESQELEFWVKRAARNLLDAVSESNINEWISGFSLDSGEEFESLPDWLKDVDATNDPVLSWLPLSVADFGSRLCDDSLEKDEGLFSQVEENGENDLKEVGEAIEVDQALNVPLEPEIEKMALSLRSRVMNFESSLKAVALANEIRQLCLDKGRDSLQVLNLIEPWKAEDETASVLISHLSCGDEEELAWPSQVLCSIVLPKFLVIEEPASRLLVTSTMEYCKLHQRASVHGLLFPLVLRSEGINNPICDVITRIVRECLHPGHVSAYCQKLLCGGEEERSFILLPCHQYLVSNELVWTESLFNLFQNILNHNVHLTEDSVDCLVYHVRQMAERFSKSLKFGNFVLCLVSKCASLLKSHKNVLTEAVECTNTLVTKSILSRLASL